jgi:hypothetical protein
MRQARPSTRQCMGCDGGHLTPADPPQTWGCEPRIPLVCCRDTFFLLTCSFVAFGWHGWHRESGGYRTGRVATRAGTATVVKLEKRRGSSEVQVRVHAFSRVGARADESGNECQTQRSQAHTRHTSCIKELRTRPAKAEAIDEAKAGQKLRTETQARCAVSYLKWQVAGENTGITGRSQPSRYRPTSRVASWLTLQCRRSMSDGGCRAERRPRVGTVRRDGQRSE